MALGIGGDFSGLGKEVARRAGDPRGLIGGVLLTDFAAVTHSPGGLSLQKKIQYALVESAHPR